jgi:hypothetical protein
MARQDYISEISRAEHWTDLSDLAFYVLLYSQNEFGGLVSSTEAKLLKQFHQDIKYLRGVQAAGYRQYK